MNKTTEALLARIEKLEAANKLAKEALESAPIEYDFHGNPMDEDYGKLSNKALAAIREALDHSGDANEMVMDWSKVKPEAIKSDPMYQMGYAAAKAEPVKQEPVYAFRRRGLDDFCTCTKERYEELADMPNLFEVTTFYAAPVSAKREWVDLTGMEHQSIYDDHHAMGGCWTDGFEYERAVIAAFKDKNK